MDKKNVKKPLPLCIFLLPILLVLFFSGCTNLPDLSTEKFSLEKEKHFEDLHYAIEVYPSSISPGKTLKLRILLEPKRDLKDVTVSITDPCLFTIDKSKAEKKLGTLEANTRRYVRFKLKAPEDVEMETNCKIRLRITYTASFNVLTDVAVLSETEKLAKSKVSTSTTKSPSALDVSVSFSKKQPFIEGEKVFIYIDYENKGNGIINELNEGDVEILLPSNLKLKSCEDYKKSANKLILNKKIIFIDNKGRRSVCLVETRANSPIDIEKLVISGKYKYEIDDSVIVTLEKR